MMGHKNHRRFPEWMGATWFHVLLIWAACGVILLYCMFADFTQAGPSTTPSTKISEPRIALANQPIR